MSELPTRERILAVTRDLLKQQNGTGALTIEQVAATAHISRATLYRHFPNKAALLRAAGVADDAMVAPTTPRERVLQATLEVIGERGMHGATLDEIAGRAGLSRSGLQWHYRNKDELVADLVQHLPVMAAMTSVVTQAAQMDSDLEAQLNQLATTLLDESRRYRGIIRFLIYEAAVYPDVAQLASTHGIGRLLPMLTRFFEQHERNGTLRAGSAQMYAQAFLGMFMSLILLRPAFSHLLAPDDQATAHEYIDILLHGILPPAREN